MFYIAQNPLCMFIEVKLILLCVIVIVAVLRPQNM